MREKWKPVDGYEQQYRVSNLGRVRSLSRTVKVKYQKTVVSEDGTLTTVEVRKTRRIPGRVLKQAVGSHGYLQVGLCKNGKVEKALVHELVARAFIGKAEGKTQVNHKDGNKLNNHVTPAGLTGQ